MQLVLTCNAMSAKKRPCYCISLQLMRPGPDVTKSNSNANQMGHHESQQFCRTPKVKIMVMIACDWDSVILRHTIPLRHNINALYC